MPDYTIQPVALDEDSTVTVSFSLVKSFEWKHRHILVIHYTGKYGWGSRGNPAAEHMNAMRIAGIERWEADGVVFDLTGLHYEWGDLISDALSFAPKRMAIVVGPHSRKGIASLLGPRQHLHDTLDSAITSVAAAMLGEAPAGAEQAEFPCSHMAHYLSQKCDQHPDPWDCPDAIIILASDGRFGIPIRDGGSSFIEIKFCPWCAARLT